MNKCLQLLFLVFFTSPIGAQNFTGQWKGQFADKSTSFVGWGGNRCDYVLEIECSGNKVTGYSYTYFNEGGKKFYTICRLKGTLNKASKYIEVTEVERTKTNVPSSIRNCFQVHRLTFFQQGDEQTLEGTWVPAPNQEGDCGYGVTTLSRRLLQKNSGLYNNTSTIKEKPVETLKNSNPPVTKNKPKQLPQSDLKIEKPAINEIEKVQPAPPVTNKNEIQNIRINPQVIPEVTKSAINFEKRNNNLIKTIEVENSSIKIDLYDNGEIDGDSISLFYNGKLLLSHQRLSDKAISLKLNLEANKDVNELIMYAENLGAIPPNTAVMVITDGENRYEVRLASDLEKSGAIRFLYKPKNGQ